MSLENDEWFARVKKENDEWFARVKKETDEWLAKVDAEPYENLTEIASCSSASNPGGASSLPKEGDSLFDRPTSTVREKPCLDKLVEGFVSSPTLGLFPPVSSSRSTAWSGSGRGSFRGGGSTKWTGSGRRR